MPGQDKNRKPDVPNDPSRLHARRLGLLLGTLIVFAALVGNAAAARPNAAVSASVSGRTATINFTVNRGPQAIAALSCTLDGSPAGCGTMAGSTKQTASYGLSLGDLDSGSHVYAVVASLTDGGTGTGQVQFTVTIPAACQIKNRSTGVRYDGAGGNLQTAINAATPGDTLTVLGLCTGTYTVNGNLTLTGIGSPRATLDGGYTGGTTYPGAVLTVNSGVAVTIANMTLQHGALDPSIGEGGLINMGAVTLTNSSVSHNTGTGISNVGAAAVLILNGTTSVDNNVSQGDGGGIRNLGGSVTLNDSSAVSGNQANRGGGIYNDNLGTVLLEGSSSVNGNTGDQGGGVFNAYGSIALNDSSSISNNTARYGGGVGNYYYLFLHDSSRISGNTASVIGGGVFNDHGTILLNGSSSVGGNTARDWGGGIFNGGGRFVTMNDNSSVSGNTSSTGGGIYNRGILLLNGTSSISGNTGNTGGGIYNEVSGGVRMNDASSIHDNTGYGGGIFNRGFLFNCNRGVNVFNNTPTDIVP